MSEIADFKRALREAGEPWRRWGIRIGFVAMVALVVLQVGPIVPYGLYALIALLVVLAGACALIVVSHLKQRQWVKDHPIEDVQAPEAS